jgi:hypothetical protein
MDDVLGLRRRVFYPCGNTSETRQKNTAVVGFQMGGPVLSGPGAGSLAVRSESPSKPGLPKEPLAM